MLPGRILCTWLEFIGVFGKIKMGVNEKFLCKKFKGWLNYLSGLCEEISVGKKCCVGITLCLNCWNTQRVAIS